MLDEETKKKLLSSYREELAALEEKREDHAAECEDLTEKELASLLACELAETEAAIRKKRQSKP